MLFNKSVLIKLSLFPLLVSNLWQFGPITAESRFKSPQLNHNYKLPVIIPPFGLGTLCPEENVSIALSVIPSFSIEIN